MMVKVENLHFHYDKKNEEILRGLDFEISKGEVFGFLGPSGAGKSTLQKILLGLLKGYTGSAKVMGREVKSVKSEYYNHVGVGFELPNLYEQLTIAENLKTFARLYKEQADIEELLKEVGLYEHRHKKVNEISKGMKMRLNFCRALIGKPEILFLDEPTSGLDPNNTKVIEEKVKNYKEAGHTVILTTHNMTFAEAICDRVAFVVEGQIKEIGEPAALRLKYGRCQVKVVTERGEDLFEIEGLGDNKAFQSRLKETLVSIDTLKPSLEEIFTIVTGRVLV